MKTNMGLPKIDFVLYLWKKLIFIKFCNKGIGQNTNFVSEKVKLGTHKSKKRAKIELTEVEPLTFTAQEYCKLYKIQY